METARTKIPEDSTLLCETCGYALTGLPTSANCPECGTPIETSLPIHRHPAPWEQPGNPVLGFIQTTAAVLFHPRRFYRTLTVRRPRRASIRFALIHWLMVALLFGWAAQVHAAAFIYSDISWINALLQNAWLSLAVFSAIAFVILLLTTPIASRLTAWEAAYRGLRLPLGVVQRSLDYHAADYLPVAMVNAIIIVGYRWLCDHRYFNSTFDAKYLYLLCAEVIAAAAYLFNTYWIGMRNLMYGNS